MRRDRRRFRLAVRALLAGAQVPRRPPCCACCGLPFEFEMGEGSLCGACTADRPLYDRARAALTYDDASRDLVLRFKHADRIDGAATFAGWMARAGAELVASADIIAPVPLHRWRLVRRRYNQAAILANAIGRSARKTRRPGPAGAAPRDSIPGSSRPQPAPPQRRRRLRPPSRPGPSGQGGADFAGRRRSDDRRDGGSLRQNPAKCRGKGRRSAGFGASCPGTADLGNIGRLPTCKLAVPGQKY